jgi:hypothetical protein
VIRGVRGVTLRAPALAEKPKRESAPSTPKRRKRGAKRRKPKHSKPRGKA